MKNIIRLLARLRCEFSLHHDWRVVVKEKIIIHTCKRCGKTVTRVI